MRFQADRLKFPDQPSAHRIVRRSIDRMGPFVAKYALQSCNGPDTVELAIGDLQRHCRRRDQNAFCRKTDHQQGDDKKPC